MPGAELHGVIYLLIVAAYAWMLFAAWVGFVGSGRAALDVSIAVVLGAVFFAVPIAMLRTAAARSRTGRKTLDEFFSSKVETATGSLSGREAAMHILLIPCGLAFAATMIGAVHMLVS